MVLTSAQSSRMIRLIDELASYANTRLNVVDHARMGRDESGSVNMEATSQVIQALWGNVSVIDDFVRENPASLGKRDLRAISQWSQGLVADFVACMLPDGRTMLYAEGRLFDVCGITHEISELFPIQPCWTRTLLVPLDGQITYLAVMARNDTVMGPNVQESFQEEIVYALNAGIISAGDKLLCEAERIRAEKEKRSTERAAEREQKEHAEHATAPGHHRGVLAGTASEMAGSATTNAASESLDELLAEMRGNPVAALDAECIHGKPKFKLAELLATMKKDELLQMALELGIPVPVLPQLKKADVVKFMAQELNNAEYLEESARAMTTGWLEALKRASDEGGMLRISDADLLSVSGIPSPPHPPVLFLFHTRREFTYVIPEELRNTIRKLDWASMRRWSALRESVLRLADAATELRGIVPMAEFTRDCRNAYPELADDQDIIKLTMQASIMVPVFRILITDDDVYLLAAKLAAEYLAINPDTTKLDSDSPTIFGPIAEPLDEILNHQEGKEPRPIGVEMPAFPVAALWRESLPRARELSDWLNANVPDGADDYSYAAVLMHRFTSMTRWGMFAPDTMADYTDALYDAGSELDLPHMQVFLDKLVAFINEQPLWTNNGWSANEIAEQRERAGLPRTAGPIVFDSIMV